MSNINTEEMKFEDSKQIIYFTKIDKYFTNNFKIIDKINKFK